MMVRCDSDFGGRCCGRVTYCGEDDGGGADDDTM